MVVGIEIENRLVRLREKMASRNLDAFVSVKLVNTYYLSGFTSLDSSRPTSFTRPIVVVIDSDSSTLIIPAFNLEAARATSAIEDIRTYIIPPPAVAARVMTVERLREIPARRVGIEEDAMSAEWVDYLRRSLPRNELVFARDLLIQLRLCKDAVELDAMRDAARLSDVAMNGSLAAYAAGQTEIGAETHGLLRLRDAVSDSDSEAFVDSIPMILSGPRSAMPHEFTTARVIGDGDVAWHCWIVGYRGYWIENIRTSVAGAHQTFDRAFAILLQSLRVGQETARSGATAGDVYHAITRVLTENPVSGGVILARSGHGVGLEYHEPPFLEDGDTTVLAPGVTITIEPGIWIPGVGGLSLSNTLVIREGDPEIITQAPVDLYHSN